MKPLSSVLLVCVVPNMNCRPTLSTHDMASCVHRFVNEHGCPCRLASGKGQRTCEFACASARETNASMHALTQIRSNNHLMPAAAPGVHTDVCRSCSVCKILNLGHVISHPMAAHYFSWAFGAEQVEHSTHPFRPRTFWPWYDFIFHLRSHHDFFLWVVTPCL